MKKTCKCFIGYEDDDNKIKPGNIELPKTSADVKNSLWRNYVEVIFIEDNALLEIYNGIWNRVSNSMKKELDWQPI